MNTASHHRPMPRPTRTSTPFWEGLEQERILMQRCLGCHRWVWYPRPHCPACSSRELEWQPLSGRASLYSFCISPRPTAPEFADALPQRLALVALAEGPRLATTLVGEDDERWQVGMALEPVFDRSGPQVLLRFAPAAAG